MLLNDVCLWLYAILNKCFSSRIIMTKYHEQQNNSLEMVALLGYSEHRVYIYF